MLRNLLYLFIAVCMCACTSGATEPIKVLIVTGQNNHNWPVSSEAMRLIFESSGLFKVDLAVSPPKGEDMSPFRPAFADYGVVVLDYNGDSWPDETNADFMEYVRNGGGVIVYHAADNAFPDWEEYNLVTALGGWEGRSEASGPYVYMKGGELIRDMSPGRAGSHGPQHVFYLKAVETRHPVTNGLPSKWLHNKDELYDSMRGPGNVKDVLYTAWSSPIQRGTDRDELLVFTVDYGDARILHTMLGHAGPTLEDNPAMQCTGFQVILLRGAEWAATGKVTQPVPADFPGVDVVSLRPDYKIPETDNKKKRTK